MDEIVKTLKIFLTRDIIFIVGGSTVIGISYYSLRSTVALSSTSPAICFVILGLGHFTGFALLSLGNFVRVVNVMDLREPGPFVLFLYRRFTKKSTWYEPDSTVDGRFAQYADERTQAEIDRINSLKQIAATMGSCAIAVCVILLTKCILQHSYQLPDTAIVVSFTCLAIVFAPLSYIMGAQQVQFIAEKTMPERIRIAAYLIWNSDNGKPAEVCWEEAKKALIYEATTYTPTRRERGRAINIADG